MSGSVAIDCVRDGRVLESIEVKASSEPPYELAVRRDGGDEVVYPGDNLFACLINLRRDLERDGILLCCQGARRDVINSGLQAQMTGGRFVYTSNALSRTVNEETVDILAPARPDEVVTVAEQRAAIFDFFGISDRSGEG
ncbi:hypothetical protein [Streptomyces sp. ISL-11]|uniref:hypothetical protein n=1 Tax=Streptomyces sp. ISL-11 TaxID=2819174 RepID=UPI001BE631D1|nr:hypothetical protein [Streptomyces sp. ISL-11]MBT2383504.1 hypothetical protein [Streptomyces sp. ISL-11]